MHESGARLPMLVLAALDLASCHSRPDLEERSTLAGARSAASASGAASAAKRRPNRDTERPPVAVPQLRAGRQLSWLVAQRGEAISPEDHALSLRREAFTLVIHVRSPARFHVWAYASFAPAALRDASAGHPFGQIHGLANASRIDELQDNKLRDILIDGPSQWVSCWPDASVCDGFDAPCLETSEGVACWRTIERFVRYQPQATSLKVEESSQSKLFLVFFVPGDWSTDEPHNKSERDRDWATIHWKD